MIKKTTYKAREAITIECNHLSAGTAVAAVNDRSRRDPHPTKPVDQPGLPTHLHYHRPRPGMNTV